MLTTMPTNVYVTMSTMMTELVIVNTLIVIIHLKVLNLWTMTKQMQYTITIIVNVLMDSKMQNMDIVIQTVTGLTEKLLLMTNTVVCVTNGTLTIIKVVFVFKIVQNIITITTKKLMSTVLVLILVWTTIVLDKVTTGTIVSGECVL